MRNFATAEYIKTKYGRRDSSEVGMCATAKGATVCECVVLYVYKKSAYLSQRKIPMQPS